MGMNTIYIHYVSVWIPQRFMKRFLLRSLMGQTRKVSRWDFSHSRARGTGRTSTHVSTSPLGMGCVGGLSWRPCPEMDCFQWTDIMGEVGTRRKGSCGDLDAKDFSAVWLLCLGYTFAWEESSRMCLRPLHPPCFLSAAAFSIIKQRLKTDT